MILDQYAVYQKNEVLKQHLILQQLVGTAATVKAMQVTIVSILFNSNLRYSDRPTE